MQDAYNAIREKLPAALAAAPTVTEIHAIAEPLLRDPEDIIIEVRRKIMGTIDSAAAKASGSYRDETRLSRYDWHQTLFQLIEDTQLDYAKGLLFMVKLRQLLRSNGVSKELIARIEELWVE